VAEGDKIGGHDCQSTDAADFSESAYAGSRSSRMGRGTGRKEKGGKPDRYFGAHSNRIQSGWGNNLRIVYEGVLFRNARWGLVWKIAQDTPL